MTSIEDLAVMIAEEVAPDEVDLAPGFVEAYAQGGAARKGLFEGTRSSGAFDAGQLLIVMPKLLASFDWTSAAILALLGSSGLSSALDCIKNGLAIAELGVRGQRTLRDTVPRSEDVRPLRELMETLCTELTREGIPQDRVEIIAFRAMRVILEHPSDSAGLVRHIASKK